ncbi:MAG: hypothetical protein COS25_00935 [Candidatus Nealsonbacteria bacterium CG02_land_8_20_14_3_00_37_10]|uniref:PEGA domain-containing protein n=2 Tax=Candidatus Nealsoniibacteriota TaxID=1817911 RepID=A0A2G9YYU9_9BACT|nr:MAG: hypothetical protein COX35_00640 [Candidatus Nealsonbacteria bacterium CG23_combo_of_CG06-09_8_20_14_all_37_18]PIV45196.1 MAG: hypothetical protein COS25_00935 [Candidatus Nealsonbacteria bacterium CG02_land_8_20_14_3_00_37_10]
MTKRTRTIIFSVCFLLFILIASSAVLYSQGYRFNLENKKFTQTGGLFFKIVPRQVDIYIDGKLNKRTDFFFGSALVENLLPKKYKIEVKKEKYHSWEKTLEIKEKEVTEAKNIVLFPQDVNFNVLSSQVEQFWFSPDQRKIILKEKEKLGWALKLYDLDKNIKSYLISGEDFFTKEPQLINLDFSEDSKKIYLEVSVGEEIKYFTLEEFDRAKPLLTERESPSPLVENVVVYQQVGNDIYYLDNSGHLFKNGERITVTPFPIKQETEYALEIFQGFIFLREDNNLYKFNSDLKVFENFFERINSLKVSPDNKKLAYFSDYEIWILFLSDKNEPPQKRAGEKLFLIRLSERIIDVFWINDNYLTFTAGDKIKISEIDDRDRLNIIDVFETKKLPQNGSPVEMFWNQFDKKLYLLNEEILYGSGALLP